MGIHGELHEPKFEGNLDQRKQNLVQDSREFKLSEIELTNERWSHNQIQGKWKIAGEFELSEFEFIPGFYYQLAVSCQTTL